MDPQSTLFKPLQIGRATLQHRIVMAPLTRFRADKDHVPLPFVKDYYAQRASVPGTLLLTEATFIAPQAAGYTHVPGIWSSAQIAAWKDVTAAVHAKGSFIFLQMWALGRVADPATLKNEGGYEVVSASDLSVEPTKDHGGGVKPKPLGECEIWEYVAAYRQAALNAVEAGFDGVEIHNANGYLLDQFLQDVSNHRTDAWGGSVENRARFSLEVARAVVDAVGAHRVGVRLSPFSSFQGMRMKDPIPQFTYLVQELRKLKLAYLHLVEARVAGNADTEHTEQIDFLVDTWDNTSPVLVAGGYKPASAQVAVDEKYKGRDVAIVFGRLFTSNPDLAFRIKKGLPLTQYDRTLFYNKTEEKGYVTWPFSQEFLVQTERL